MKERSSSFLLSLLSFSLVFCFTGSVEAYKNYTVGDSIGWFDKLEKSGVDYQKWANDGDKSFTLGDFLIFNTDNNHSVVQTYNATTYKLCDYNNALGTDTTQWSEADPSATEPHPVTVSIPLMKEGPNYFFSGNYDGEQCESGQHFNITVTHGQGLPKSLDTSTQDDAFAPNSAQSGDDESAPDTIVPANFDHPQDVESDEDKDKNSSGSVSLIGSFFDKKLNMLLWVLTGCVWMF